MSKIKPWLVIVSGVLVLFVMVAFSRAKPTSSAEPQATFPRGIIIAWNAKSGAVPAGWVVCDGTNGTPDLRGRFLMGVATFADVGQTPGQATHRHGVNGGTNNARSGSDGWGFEANADRKRSPSVTGLDHTHTFSATTGDANHLPPSYTVLYLMKL
jgi:hypothetical protein